MPRYRRTKSQSHFVPESDLPTSGNGLFVEVALEDRFELPITIVRHMIDLAPILERLPESHILDVVGPLGEGLFFTMPAPMPLVFALADELQSSAISARLEDYLARPLISMNRTGFGLFIAPEPGTDDFGVPSC